MVVSRGVEVELEPVIAGLDPAIHQLRKALPKGMDARVKPGHDNLLCGRSLVTAYAASTSTSSESSSAVIFSFASSRIATPSRALTRTPLISTVPAAGTRLRMLLLFGAYSALLSALNVV